MSERLVIDASAALHLVLRSAEAPWLAIALERCSIVLAPSLFATEVANGLWKYVGSKDIEIGEAIGLYDEALGVVDRLVADSELGTESLAAAAQYDHPVYDLLYAVLARRNGCAVLTTDRRLKVLLARMEIGTITK